MEPTKQLNWVAGLKAGFTSIGATQRDPYSWVAKSEQSYVFTAEIDHINKENNSYHHKNGVFLKNTPPMSKALGHSAQSVSHSKELLEAVSESYSKKLKCQLLLVRGTKFGTTTTGIRSAVDGNYWQVTEFAGTVELGYSFKLERVE